MRGRGTGRGRHARHGAVYLRGVAPRACGGIGSAVGPPRAPPRRSRPPPPNPPPPIPLHLPPPRSPPHEAGARATPPPSEPEVLAAPRVVKHPDRGRDMVPGGWVRDVGVSVAGVGSAIGLPAPASPERERMR